MTEKKKTGRKLLNIDVEQLKQLAAINCSYAEMAAVLKCDESTLTKRFSQVIKEGRENGKASLKRMMWKNANAGNCSMQIFLSKNLLGYSDKSKEEIESQKAPVNIIFERDSE